MALQLFVKNGLAIHLYYDEANVKNGKLSVQNLYLIMPGLPQFTDRRVFADLVSKNAAFFYVHYYGSWFSDGVFTPDNCRRSLLDALKLAKLGKGIKTWDNQAFKWDYKKLILVGNSFGSVPILSLSKRLEGIDRIYLLCPLLYTATTDLKKFLNTNELAAYQQNDLGNFLDFMRRGYRNIYRGIYKSSWDGYFKKGVKIFSDKSLALLPPISILHGSLDATVPDSSSRYFANNQPKVKLKVVDGYEHDFTGLLTLLIKKGYEDIKSKR